MRYELYYHAANPGRGEFIRLPLEDAGAPLRLCRSAMIRLFEIWTLPTINRPKSLIRPWASASSEMSFPAMSRRKSWAWSPPPFVNSTSKSKQTLLSSMRLSLAFGSLSEGADLRRQREEAVAGVAATAERI